MGLLDKVKNFFYDDEEIEEEEEEIEVPVRVRHKEKKEKPKEEVSERELFRAERTFNFPMNVDDDTMIGFNKIEEKEESKQLEKTNADLNVYRQEKTNVDVNIYRQEKPKESIYSGLRAYSKIEPQPEVKKEEPKKFKPTPVISPIFGVLDKNYKKEDIIDNTNNEDDYNIPKKVDYDSVRKRAYGNIYRTEEPVVESEPEEETKGIFYNLDEEEVEEKEEITSAEEFDNDEEVKIIYNDVTFDEEPENEQESVSEDTEEVEEDNQPEEDYEEKDEHEDENILSETKEQDLFNLIDNMYNSDEEEEEEE